MSKCFRGIAHASDRQATLHGVVFDISGARAASAWRPSSEWRERSYVRAPGVAARTWATLAVTVTVAAICRVNPWMCDERVRREAASLD